MVYSCEGEHRFRIDVNAHSRQIKIIIDEINNWFYTYPRYLISEHRGN